MTKEELMLVTGGGSINASLVNAIVRFATILLEIGRTIGSVINRTTTKNFC